MTSYGPADIEALMSELNLPGLPGETFEDDPEARDLILFRFQDENIVLTAFSAGVSITDAKEYCSDKALKGDDWFVGFDKR
jgi:hypothetical protein